MTAGETELVWVPFTVEARYDGLRVDRFLANRLAAYSRSRVQRILNEGRIQRAGRLVKASSKVSSGDRIFIAYPRRPEKPLPENAALPVLFEDADYLIISKPSGLLSHPTDKIQLHTVLGVLRHCRPDIARFHLLHRLDRETSGVLALGKTVQAARSWTQAMERHEIQKEYLALVHGVAPDGGEIDYSIGRENGEIKVRQCITAAEPVPAFTEFVRLAVSRDHSVSLIRAWPKTGRLHQIRVHFASSGHPLLGDALYIDGGRMYKKMIAGNITPEDRQTLGFPRVALHALALSFNHPRTRIPLKTTAPLPGDMRDFIDVRFDHSEEIDTLLNRRRPGNQLSGAH
jgi:23S rRNA pseudouridine1911/1915/1917 synthase